MRRLIPALLAVVMAVVMTACSAQKPLTRYTYTFYDTFDTVVILVGYAEDEETFNRAAAVCEAEFVRMHGLYNPYLHANGTNNVWTLNEKAWKQPMVVDADIMNLLLLCKEWAGMSPVVNPAMGRVLRLWHNARDNAESEPWNAAIPSADDLTAAAEHTSLDDLVLDPAAMTVWYDDPLLRLDLGAVAKGYAAGKAGEKVAEIMPVYSINAGGNIVMGESYKAEGWKVGVQDPDAALFISDDPYVCTLQAKNCAIVTSGDYQRFFYADGVAYHHLIDPETNMPAKHYRAVTIVAPDSALADWYSTAAFLLPPDESRALIAAGNGVEAMWIHPDGTVEMTDGFKAMVVTETAE